MVAPRLAWESRPLATAHPVRRVRRSCSSVSSDFEASCIIAVQLPRRRALLTPFRVYLTRASSAEPIASWNVDAPSFGPDNRSFGCDRPRTEDWLNMGPYAVSEPWHTSRSPSWAFPPWPANSTHPSGLVRSAAKAPLQIRTPMVERNVMTDAPKETRAVIATTEMTPRMSAYLARRWPCSLRAGLARSRTMEVSTGVVL